MANGVYPTDYATDVGKIRLLIPDTAVDTSNNYLFSDDQLTALLGLYDDNVKRSAAQAKDIIASETTMLLKYVVTDDLQVDGPKVAAELRAQAKELRAQADTSDNSEVFDYFDIVYPQGQTASVPEGSAYPFWLGAE